MRYRKSLLDLFSSQISKLAQQPVIAVLRRNMALSVLRAIVQE